LPAVPFRSDPIAASTSACDGTSPDAPSAGALAVTPLAVTVAPGTPPVTEMACALPANTIVAAIAASKARIAPANLMTPPWYVPWPDGQQRTQVSKKMRRFHPAR
jgi:hypothetical protein